MSLTARVRVRVSFRISTGVRVRVRVVEKDPNPNPNSDRECVPPGHPVLSVVATWQKMMVSHIVRVRGRFRVGYVRLGNYDFKNAI